jgi:amino acid adenylation domain-containing protein
MDDLKAFLANLRAQGIAVWTEKGTLRFRAPRGAMTQAIRQELQTRKAEILALLHQTGVEPIARIQEAEDYPSSRAQQRTWVQSQDARSAAAYNIPLKLLLVGELREDAFRQALEALVERHESLRTSFVLRDTELRQIVNRVTVPLTSVDLTHHGAQQLEIDRLARDEALRPFDLGTAPLVRAVLVKLGARHHALLLTVHHIVCDGWSLGIMLRDFSVLYRRASGRSAAALPELPLQYRDYASWHNRLLENGDMAIHREYWLEVLKKPLPVLNLAADFARRPAAAVHGAAVERRFDLHTAGRLRALAREFEASLFIVLTTVVNVLLHRYTGEDDILVGSPVAGRVHPDLVDQIGVYLNTIVLRTRIRSDEPFDVLLRRVKATAVDAYEHDAYPFDVLVDEVGSTREAGHSMLFDVAIILQGGQASSPETEDLEFHHLPGQVYTTKFDLTFDFAERENGLHLGIEYNTDLFKEQRIQRMGAHFDELVASILENPRQQVGRLRLASADERREILARQRRSEPPVTSTVVGAIEAQVARSPAATAVCFGDETLTYDKLNQRANQLARWLALQGVGPEVAVGVCARRSLELVVALLGVLKAGGFYVPLDPDYPKDRREFMAADSGIAVLVTDQSTAEPGFTSAVPRVNLDTDRYAISRQRSDNPSARILPANAAYTIYTSGSTGRPKGVQISHGSLLNLLIAVSREPGLSADDVFLASTTISFDIAALELYLPLITGARLVVCPSDTAADGTRLLELVEKTTPTAMQLTPAGWQMLLHAGWVGSSQLKILCGGEALSPRLASELLRRGASCWNLYGPTETTVWSAAGQVFETDAVGSDAASIAIGPELRNTQFHVLDRRLQLLPPGVPGELHIAGDGLARGYVGQPALTAERFVPNPFGNGDRLYKTGDLAELRPDGRLRFLGRLDTQVKLRGHRIETAEVETVLSRHDAIDQVAITVHTDATGDQQLLAYVVPRSQCEDLTTELRSFLLARVPTYMVPTTFVILDALPVSPAGKIDRRALPTPILEVSRPLVQPRDEIEAAIAAVWQDVLKVKQVGIRDNFFELGGNSLKGTAALATITRSLGARLTIADLLTDPTIEGLARICRTNAGKTYSAIPTIDDRLAMEPASVRRERTPPAATGTGATP